jgi:hypothetical protein
MEAILSSEMWVHTISTRRNIPEDGLLHNNKFLEKEDDVVLNGLIWLRIATSGWPL